MTSIVNAIRDLFTQQPVGSGIWIALAWMVGIGVVAYSFAIVIYRRKIAEGSVSLHRWAGGGRWSIRARLNAERTESFATLRRGRSIGQRLSRNAMMESGAR